MPLFSLQYDCFGDSINRLSFAVTSRAFIMKLIIIAGASASGKSTLAKRLTHWLKEAGESSQYMTMDDYYSDIPSDYHEQVPAEHHHPVPESYHFKDDPNGTVITHYRTHTNFDAYDMYDHEKLMLDLTALNLGEPIRQGIFDFESNTHPTSRIITPPDFLVLDGLYALHFAQALRNEFDKLTIFTSTDSYLELKKRRMQRDTKERGRTEEQVLFQENKYVGPAFFGLALPGACATNSIINHPYSVTRSKLGVDLDISNNESFDIPKDPDWPESYNPHTGIETPHPLDNEISSIFETLGLTLPERPIMPTRETSSGPTI